MIIDTNVSLSHWPCRRLPGDELGKLVNKLRAHGISEAWASSFDGILHTDLRAVNSRLDASCKSVSELTLEPFGVVNPLLTDWREDLRLCHERHGMGGIRLFPAYHGYQLKSAVFGELLALASQYGMIVQIAVRLEDPRVQHSRLRATDVEVTPLIEQLGQHSRTAIVLLNALQSVRGETLHSLAKTRRVFFEISTLEGMSGIHQCLETLPLGQLLFGSHFPFFVLESSLLKLRESSLSPQQLAAITFENALRCRHQAAACVES